MIKSYHDWGVDQRYFTDLRTFLEFNLWTTLQNMGGKGMSQEVKAGYERLGTMIGYAPSGWNVLSRDSSQWGLNFMNTVQKDPNSAMKMIKQGSPLQLVYRLFDQFKQRYGNGALDSDNLMSIVNILMNSYNSGTVDFGELRKLWNIITGIENHPDDESIKKLAEQDSLITPLDLLMKAFGIGNGIFSAPANISTLRKDATEVMGQYFPEIYKTRLKINPGKTKKDPKSKVDPADLDSLNTSIDELEKALPGGDPAVIGAVIKTLQPILKKVKDALNTKTP